MPTKHRDHGLTSRSRNLMTNRGAAAVLFQCTIRINGPCAQQERRAGLQECCSRAFRNESLYLAIGHTILTGDLGPLGHLSTYTILWKTSKRAGGYTSGQPARWLWSSKLDTTTTTALSILSFNYTLIIIGNAVQEVIFYHDIVMLAGE
ncbi:hypothetical protein J6590_053140 [Homalodisca vitripennis]|nr:hypothetical protein J6590_053140 [Homalodisca vitripennis]